MSATRCCNWVLPKFPLRITFSDIPWSFRVLDDGEVGRLPNAACTSAITDFGVLSMPAMAARGAVSRLRASARMHPTMLNHIVISSNQPYADLLLLVEAQRQPSPAAGSRSDV